MNGYGTRLRMLQRRLLNSKYLPLTVTSIGAVVAALLKQAIGVWTHSPWSWREFGQDLVQNAFIAVLITYAVAQIGRYQARMLVQRLQSEYILDRLEVIALAISGWNTIPETPAQPLSTRRPGPDVLEVLAACTEKWRKLGSDLEVIRGDVRVGSGVDRDPSAERLMQTGVLFEVSKGSIEAYLLEGGRTRRIIWLRWLVDDLARIEDSPDQALANRAHTCRRAAIELQAWIQHTDATIVERLIVERFPTQDQNSSLSEYEKLTGKAPYRIEQAAITFDHSYLLLDFIRNAQALFSDPAEADRDQQAKILLNTVQRSLGALRNELFCAAALAEELSHLVQQARTLRTT